MKSFILYFLGINLWAFIVMIITGVDFKLNLIATVALLALFRTFEKPHEEKS